jgi:hypothetical protein
LNEKQQALLNEILAILAIGANVAQTVPNADVQAGSAIAAALLQIAQKSIGAYEAQTGQPIDLALLHPIDPVA